ncbi:aspartate/glutamate racemase family protein [Bosea sp. 124]|uniref:aspartate/glutamate racemase family protein n=1 Tax=Bosea sp. 124 TaxID=2135642 RepID=UPI000D3592C6|nr:aspartate/glutamate racemase family protein [Bosea sp. 124]PTM43390.1 Asp/Glu/hydantoin racemase [Bosea sp. 124]
MTDTTEAAPRIALIHALEESVLPARAAFSAHWPQAKAFDLLDTSLATDLAARGSLDAAMTERFLTLGRYAVATEGTAGPAKAILFTCSAFGPAIDAVKRDLPIPVLRPNESAFAEALALGGRIGLVVTFAPSLPSLTQELNEMAGKPVDVAGIVVDGALAALKAGDGEMHDRLVAAEVARLGGIDTLILGQFSLARAKPAIEAATGLRVVTTPEAAIRGLKRALDTAAP